MNRNPQALRAAVLLLVTVGLSACGGGGSDVGPSTGAGVAPSVQAASAPQSSAPLAVAWPPVNGASREFDYSSAVALPVRDYTRASRFVLYDNGTFMLQLVDPNSTQILNYLGRYQEANGVITFDWDGSSKAGPWGATGTLSGKSLTIQYNLIMQLTDFEDAVYVRTS